MNIWLEGLYLEEIREKEKSKSEDSSLVEKQEELQDITAKGRSENVKADRIRDNGKG
jgi:hypothetical protein